MDRKILEAYAKNLVEFNFTLKIAPTVNPATINFLIPKLYFLDICTADIIKRDPRRLKAEKIKTYNKLKFLDLPHNGFSYITALIEKTNDEQTRLNDGELIQQIINDIKSIKGFFLQAKVTEDEQLIISHYESLRSAPAEERRDIYLKFLKNINDELEPWNKTAKEKRLTKAQIIINNADSLKIPRWHPVVIVTLAYLYQNPFAIQIMKFKKKNFMPGNALADILLIERVAMIKNDLKREGIIPRVYRSVEILTDDFGLAGVAPHITLEAKRNGEQEVDFEMSGNIRALFFYCDEAKAEPELDENEYEQLISLLHAPT